MTHPSRSNHIETNSPGAIAKGPVYGHLIKTKFLLFINNWLWREKQFYHFSKIQAPILATIYFYCLFTIIYKIVIQNTNSSQNPCFPPRQHPSGPVFSPFRGNNCGSRPCLDRRLVFGPSVECGLDDFWHNRAGCPRIVDSLP